jgi:hypothetical protein
MKHTLFPSVILIGVVSSAWADQFQIREAKGTAKADVGYATVKVMDGGAVRFEGRTDKYGRITLSLPNGKYQAAVVSGSRNASVDLVVDGDKKLKEALIK